MTRCGMYSPPVPEWDVPFPDGDEQKTKKTKKHIPSNEGYTNGPDGIIAKFENFAVKEYLEDGILSRIKVNGHTYGLGEVVNGRLVTQIATHQETSPYARIPQFVLMDEQMNPIPYHLKGRAVEVWYQPFEPF